jgi:hypothetical protein
MNLKKLFNRFGGAFGASGPAALDKAMLRAAKKGDTGALIALVDAGATSNAGLCLRWSASRGNTIAVEKLLSVPALDLGDADVDDALRRARQNAHPDTARVIGNWLDHHRPD